MQGPRQQHLRCNSSDVPRLPRAAVHHPNRTRAPLQRGNVTMTRQVKGTSVAMWDESTANLNSSLAQDIYDKTDQNLTVTGYLPQGELPVCRNGSDNVGQGGMRAEWPGGRTHVATLVVEVVLVDHVGVEVCTRVMACGCCYYDDAHVQLNLSAWVSVYAGGG